MIPPNSVLLTTRATIGEVAINRIPVATNQGFQNLIPKCGTDPVWLYYYISHINQELKRRASGSTFREVSRKDIRSLIILLPPLADQKKIANILESTDDFIERTEDLITKTGQLRDSLIHELLTRGLPGHHTEWKEVPWLGTIPAKWQIVCLNDILIISQPGAWGNQPTSDNPGVPVLRATNLTRDGRIVFEDVAIRALSGHDLLHRSMQDGDIILEKSGGGPGTPVGRVGLIKSFGTVYCNNFCQHLRVDKEVCDPQYTVQALHHRYMKGLTSRLEHQTTGIRNLDLDGYLRLPFPLPPLSEQVIIAKLLEQLEHVIDEYKHIKSNLLLLKLSLSDDLFRDNERG